MDRITQLTSGVGQSTIAASQFTTRQFSLRDFKLMSMDPNSPEPYAAQTPPGKSGGSKIWLFLGLGCGVMLLLCCGGGVTMFFVGKNALALTQDPAEVTRKASEIADIELPQGFKPQMAMSMNMPFVGTPIMKMVVYEAASTEGGLFLFEFGQMPGANEEQMKLQMQNSMNQQGQRMKQLRVLETRNVEVEIRNQPATFQIQQAEDQQSKQRYIQVEGIFEGKEGRAMIVAQLKADDFTEDDAEKLVRSIK